MSTNDVSIILKPFTKSIVKIPENTISTTWTAKDSEGKSISHAHGFKEIGTTKETSDHISTYRKCEKRWKVGRKLCRKYSSPKYSKGGFDSASVPLGAWAEINNSPCSGSTKTSIIDSGTKLPDDIAMKCATKYTDDPECFITTTKANHTTLKDCFKSGIHYPTFCQLGDFVESVPQCKTQCASAKPGDNNYCSWSKERFCTMSPGDMITPERESIKFNIIEPTCQEFCGGPTDPNCQAAKDAYCSSNNPDLEYCKAFWQSRGITSKAEELCRTKLLAGEIEDPESSCGKLCEPNSEVNTEFCTGIREEYCSNNVFTPYCHQWCKDNLDKCSATLTLQCANKEDMIGETVPNTDMTFGDWCGCFMPDTTYSKYITDTIKEVEEKGFQWGRTPTEIKPQCHYPFCANNPKVLKTKTQAATECNDCIDNVFSKYALLKDEELLGCDAITIRPPNNNTMAPLDEEPEGMPVSNGEEKPVVVIFEDGTNASFANMVLAKPPVFDKKAYVDGKLVTGEDVYHLLRERFPHKIPDAVDTTPDDLKTIEEENKIMTGDNISYDSTNTVTEDSKIDSSNSEKVDKKEDIMVSSDGDVVVTKDENGKIKVTDISNTSNTDDETKKGIQTISNILIGLVVFILIIILLAFFALIIIFAVRRLNENDAKK